MASPMKNIQKLGNSSARNVTIHQFNLKKKKSEITNQYITKEFGLWQKEKKEKLIIAPFEVSESIEKPSIQHLNELALTGKVK